MGFFSWVKNEFNKATHAVGHFVSGVTHKVESAVGYVVNTGSNAVKTVYNDAKGAVKHVTGDIEGGAKAIYHTGSNLVNSGVNLLQKGESDVLGKHGIVQNTTSGLLETLAIPLILVGVGVIFLSRNSSATVSYAR